MSDRWSPYAKTYEPLAVGSIDGTDTVPHDNGIARAIQSGVGDVFLAKDKNKTHVSLKRYDLEKVLNVDDLTQIEKEIRLVRQLKHVNVISYESCYVEDRYLYVISDMNGYRSCTDLIAAHFTEGLPELVVALVLSDVLKALMYIHEKGYVHRGVRGSHILLSTDGRAILSGFRYAESLIKDGKWLKQIHSFPTSISANLNWLSPEILEQNLDGYNEKSDIYSVGITCAELASGCVPFSNLSSTLMLTEKVKRSGVMTLKPYKVTNKNSSDNEKTFYDPNLIISKKGLSDYFYQFLNLCLIKETTLRPSASKLQNHAFFSQLKPRKCVDLNQLLHPLIPITHESIEKDTGDAKATLANASKMAGINIGEGIEWNF